MRVILIGLACYVMPALLWFMAGRAAQRPGMALALAAVFVMALLQPAISAALALRRERRALAATDPVEAERQRRDIDEATRLVMSPDFDIAASVVPPGRVGGPPRPRKHQTWREAVGPHLR